MNDVNGVVDVLKALENLLRPARVAAWPDRLACIRVHIEQDEMRTEERKAEIRALFRGTMGSLPDRIISTTNGHVVEDESRANAEFDRLRDELRRLTKDLKRRVGFGRADSRHDWRRHLAVESADCADCADSADSSLVG